ncbi:MAG: sugar-transfer associated ATP-grasp domain-containing protein [Rikenellaceae bacterium]
MNIKNLLLKAIIQGRVISRKKYRRNQNKQRLSTSDILTKEQIDSVKKYWSPFYKHVPIDDFKFYTTRTGVFSTKYIPDLIASAYIYTRLNDPLKAEFLDDKNYYDMFFHDIEQPKTILRRKEKCFLDSNYCMIDIERSINLCKLEGNVIIKASRASNGGHGISFWSYLEQSDEELREILTRHDDIVVQEVVAQHENLARLHPASLNTIRLITLNHEKIGVKCLSSMLRFGANNSKVDNCSSGGMCCGITESGRLKAVAFDILGRKEYKHLDTGVAFLDITVPSFDKIQELVLRLHDRFPEFGLLSWDIVVKKDGTPMLIEFNIDDGDVGLLQLNNGPLFGEYTDLILSEVFNKKRK